MAYATIRKVILMLKEDRVLSDDMKKRQMIRKGMILEKLTA